MILTLSVIGALVLTVFLAAWVYALEGRIEKLERETFKGLK